MEYSAILHRPMSEYAFAVDESHYIFRLRAKRGDLRECRFWYADRASMEKELSFSSTDMRLARSDKYYDYFEASLETEFLRIAYYFEIYDGEERAYYLGDCFEDTPDVGRADYFQLPFNLRADRVTVPEWVSSAVVYNIFPDSFASGRHVISDIGVTAEHKGRECLSLHGGTIRGIEENLDYIKWLGCNCIYLNPIFAADSYHKYDITDYFHIDPTRGSDEDFRRLVETAHSMGLRVIIDGVFNHTSYRHPFFADVLSRGRESEYYGRYYDLPEQPVYPADGGEPEYICFAYVPEMPKTNTADKGMREYFCEVGAYWVREYDVDGWRLDVANEMDDGFLRAFYETVKREKPDALVIGEVWENASHYVNGRMMDGAMNYDLRRFCRQFFAEGRIDAEEFDARVTGLLMRYPRQVIFAQLNLLDSHDVSRFLTLCGGDADRLELAVLFQMTFIGMPSIFYGDEKGLIGEEESEYRQPMRFTDGGVIEEIYRRLIGLRNEYEALRTGEYVTTCAAGGVYGYRRVAGQTIDILMNVGSEAARLPEVLSDGGRVLLQKGVKCGLLEGYGYRVTVSA